MSTASESHPSPRLARPDPRPFVVTLAAAGWLVICVLGALNAAGVYANHTLGGSDPQRDARADWIAAYDPIEAHEERARQQSVASLEKQFAPLFFGAAALGILGAVGLLRRRPWSRWALWTTGLLAVGVPVLFQLRTVELHTAEAIGIPDGDAAATTVLTFAMINVAVQAIPIAILCGLLRHPALRHYLATAPVDEPRAPN